MTDSFTPFEASATGLSISACFERQAERHAGRLAVHGRQDLTYAELNHFANRMARDIRSVSPDFAESSEPIAVLLPRGVESIAALVATLKAGKIWVPLDASLPRDRIAAQIADSQAGLIVTDPAHAVLAESLAPGRVLVVEVPASIAACENLLLAIPPDAPAGIQYTSGSTGSPKGVLQLHRNILHNVRCHSEAGRIGPGDRFVPNGLMGSLNALLNGAGVFPYAVKEGSLGVLSGWLRENEITVLSAVPTTFRRFAAQLTEEDRFPRLRLIKLTGEAIYGRDVELFQQRFSRGCVLQFSFALTETNAVAWRTIDHDTKVDQDLVPVGTPVVGKEVLLLDDQRRPVARGETGEIAVRSRYLAAGYWRQPELTAARFLPDPEDPDVRTYLTGDLGRIGPDGMLVHLGRKDSQVKIRANRVELAEVEAALRGVEGVRDAAVVARLDDAGENLSGGIFRRLADAATAIRRGAPRSGAEVARLHGPRHGDGIAPFAAASEWQGRPAIPVRCAASGAGARCWAFIPPRTTMESLVAETWRAILRVERVGTSDNFFDLGGNSLAAVESATVLERKTGVRMSPVAMASQTLAQVAGMYQERSTATLPTNGGLMPTLRRFLVGPREP